jgi:hypothetical protein
MENDCILWKGDVYFLQRTLVYTSYNLDTLGRVSKTLLTNKSFEEH